MPPVVPPRPHLMRCWDMEGLDVTCKAGLRDVNEFCKRPDAMRACALTCDTCTALTVPINVAFLHGGVLPIPANYSTLIFEIGASDRNTADLEILPRLPNAFVVTAEPLLDKYARALGRRRPATEIIEILEPLGQHHDRGLILPIAVGPVAAIDASEAFRHAGATSGRGKVSSFTVSAVSGCSSLAKMAPRSQFGAWCRSGRSQRQVWTVPLAQMLEWAGGRQIDFIKIDAQGLDLDIVLSGGPMLSRVMRVAMETISDDCTWAARPILHPPPPPSARRLSSSLARRPRPKPGAPLSPNPRAQAALRRPKDLLGRGRGDGRRGVRAALAAAVPAGAGPRQEEPLL